MLTMTEIRAGVRNLPDLVRGPAMALAALLMGVLLAVVMLGAVAIVTAHSARAEGVPAKAAAYPAAPAGASDPWTGFWAGASVGWGATRSEFQTVLDGDQARHLDDILVTPAVGFDVRLANVVLGLTADATWSDLKKAWDAGGAVDAEWQWFVGARAGFLATPETLVYALGGLTVLEGGFRFEAFEATRLGDIKGLTVGGGAEHIFAPGWAAKLEYRWVSLGSDNAPAGVLDGLADGTDVDTGAHQVRLGIVHRFGGGK
jgi:outer membrane immunogenic protein